MRITFAISFCASLLGGCAAERPAELPPASTVESLPAPVDTGSAAGSTMPGSADTPTAPSVPFAGKLNQSAVGRYYLTSDKTLTSTILPDRPRAFIILDPTNTGKNRKACRAFQKLASGEALTESDASLRVIPTFWMLKTTSVASNCNQLVSDYDFNRAATFRRIPRTSRGIYLVAIDRSGATFYIDMSAASDQQLEEAMLNWFATAQVKVAEGEGLVIQSNSILARLQRGACSIITDKDEANRDVTGILANVSWVLTGRIILRAGGSALCERVA